MKNYLFIFRGDTNAQPTGTPEEAQAMTQRWIDWITSIAAQNKLESRGNKLENSGRLLKPNDIITNGPYVEIKELIGGYSIVKAASYDEAVELAKGCPGLAVGGTVEVREVSIM